MQNKSTIGDIANISPKHIQIETINGVCSARCTMCTINTWTRPKHLMPMEHFSCILEKLRSIKGQQFLTLHGLGEPLLDKELPEKVALAKHMSFQGVGFASNCTHLTESMAKRLLEARLDTLICSVDGATKHTHENIRIGTNFEEIIANIKGLIRMRNTRGAHTRVLVRFINQESNTHEWDAYQAFWNDVLDKERGDGVLRFDVHNWGEEHKLERKNCNGGVSSYCADLFERLIIQANGDLSLCCADDNNYFNLGNALQADPLKLYNQEVFVKFRKASLKGRLMELAPCAQCTIPLSRQTRVLTDHVHEVRHEK